MDEVMKIIKIPIKEIHRDFFFRFQTPTDASRLRDSIKLSGITTPLRVQERSNGYLILSGFHRYQCAGELGLDCVPAILIPSSEEPGEVFHQILTEHLVCRSLNLMEKSRILSILGKLALSDETVREKFLPLLEIPHQKNVISQISGLIDCSETLKCYIEKYDLPLKQALTFRSQDLWVQEKLASLGFSLQIRSVELTDILHQLQDIAGHDGSSVKKVFQKLKMEKILQNEDMPRIETLNTIKTMLKEKKYPRLTSWNQDLSALRKRLNLPENLQLAWDPTLESPGLRLQYVVRSPADWQNMARCLSKKENQEAVESMLQIV
jgi:hypothetical protein